MYDPLADHIRQEYNGEFLVHYMAPLVDDGEVFIVSRGASEWVSCRSGRLSLRSAALGANGMGRHEVN